MKTTFIEVITGSFFLVPVLVFANGADGYGHMMGWGGGMMSGLWGTLAFLTWLVWLVVGVLAIVWFWRQINDK